MPDIFIELGETIGMEFEVDKILGGQIRVDNFRTTHDASCESDVFYAGELILEKIDSSLEKVLVKQKTTIGTELVSGIHKVDKNFYSVISKLTTKLTELGEPPTSLRSGIHFHISLAEPNLRILKAVLRLGKFLEQIFFTVGGMGYEFRGVENDSTYCRPITKFGPPCVPLYNGGYGQCFNIYDMLKSETIENFYSCYGDILNTGGKRYHPVRYSWLNLYPLTKFGDYKGTLEFRIFNKTLNPDFIFACATLCKGFVNHAIVSSYSTLSQQALLKENSIYSDDITKEQMERDLRIFAEIIDFDQEILKVLIYMLYNSPTPKLPKTYIYTHLKRDLGGFFSGTYQPKRISDTKLISLPKYTDLHVLRGEA